MDRASFPTRFTHRQKFFRLTESQVGRAERRDRFVRLATPFKKAAHISAAQALLPLAADSIRVISPVVTSTAWVTVGDQTAIPAGVAVFVGRIGATVWE
jgi:hypothetical protein